MLAILLSAGKGRRIGTPKAFLDLGGRSAWKRCVETLAESGLERIRIVVSPSGARRLAEEAAADPAGTVPVEIVVNPTPELGQTSSLKCALDGVREDFLLHTVDHPLVSSADIRRLMEAWKARRPGTAIVVPSVDGRRGHPALHAAALAPEFLALADEAPAHTVIRSDAGRVEHVLLEDPWIVRDIDEPTDLQAAAEELARRET